MLSCSRYWLSLLYKSFSLTVFNVKLAWIYQAQPLKITANSDTLFSVLRMYTANRFRKTHCTTVYFWQLPAATRGRFIGPPSDPPSPPPPLRAEAGRPRGPSPPPRATTAHVAFIIISHSVYDPSLPIPTCPAPGHVLSSSQGTWSGLY